MACGFLHFLLHRAVDELAMSSCVMGGVCGMIQRGSVFVSMIMDQVLMETGLVTTIRTLPHSTTTGRQTSDV